MINLKVGPKGEEYTFLVDTGADRTCVLRTPEGCNTNKDFIEVLGAGGKPFRVPIIPSVKICTNNREALGDILLVPEAGNNLLGRDFQIKLNLGIFPCKTGTMVKIDSLSETSG